jgi:catalase
MSIKFHLPVGSEIDRVINSFKFFPVSSSADFLEMLLAVAESPPGAPRPTKLDQFAASHPNMPRALATVQTPDSFADEEYYGVNAILVNDKGERHAVRYVMAPEKLVHLTAEEAARFSDR